MREGVVVNGGSHCKGLCVGAEFERTTKMESENEHENGHFCRSEGRVPFIKNEPFFSSFLSHSEVHS